MHDQWYANTAENGAGIADDAVASLAGDIGLNGQQLVDCANAGTYDDEIAADLSDATAAGINGTPGFVVGVLNSDGTVTGEVISGAYPFSEFERAIQAIL